MPTRTRQEQQDLIWRMKALSIIWSCIIIAFCLIDYLVTSKII
jgi:hypothetical protein